MFNINLSLISRAGLSPATKATPRRKPPERILEEQRASPSSSGSTFLQNPHFWVDVTATTINALVRSYSCIVYDRKQLVVWYIAKQYVCNHD